MSYTSSALEDLMKSTVYSSFREDIWGVDLAKMKLLRKFNDGIRFLLCIVDISSKYPWDFPSKN